MGFNDDFEGNEEDDFGIFNDYEGIEESPIPDMAAPPKEPTVNNSSKQPRQSNEQANSKPTEGTRTANSNHVRQNNGQFNSGSARRTRVDNSNQTRRYNEQASSGAREARTETINQGYAQMGKRVDTQQQSPNQQRRPVNNQQVARRRPQPQQQGRQAPNRQMQGRNVQPQRRQMPPQQSQQLQQQRPKKKSKMFIVLGIALIGVVALGAIKIIGNKSPQAQEKVYEKTGRYALDNLNKALNNYDAKKIDAVVGTKNGDSYLAQEWAYVNNVKFREDFIKKVCALVKFEYPQVQQKSVDGVGMTASDGSKIMVESYMDDGESFKVSIPDYDKISETMDADVDYIKQLFKASNYREEDYTWNDELTNLMLQYICDKESLPTKKVDMVLPLRLSTSGKPYIEDDASLDDVLFGSDEFHNMCAKFSQLCLGWTGFKDEEYVTRVEKHNKEYDEWYKLFIKYYEADNGKFNKNTSKWEPWYLRDKNNKFIYDDKGKKVVNYYSVKDKNGNDWIQPDKTVMVKTKKIRQVEDPWVEETGILYSWIGQNYIKNRYKGVGDTTIQVGDGTREHPAGIGTKVITKMLCTDGKFHDVRIALLGYWTDQNAIDYAEKFSTKNRGFTIDSVVQLICYEIRIENLENRDITFNASEMTLADRNTNISSRTGTMYGFSETVTIKAKETKIINDWATSTELAQKYVCWGKNFKRDYSIVFFNILAGSGKIPTYSAYKQFTGESSMEDSNTASDNTSVNNSASEDGTSDTDATSDTDGTSDTDTTSDTDGTLDEDATSDTGGTSDEGVTDDSDTSE